LPQCRSTAPRRCSLPSKARFLKDERLRGLVEPVSVGLAVRLMAGVEGRG